MSELNVESFSSGVLGVTVEKDFITLSTKDDAVELRIVDWPEVRNWIDWKVKNLTETEK